MISNMFPELLLQDDVVVVDRMMDVSNSLSLESLILHVPMVLLEMPEYSLQVYQHKTPMRHYPTSYVLIPNDSLLGL